MKRRQFLGRNLAVALSGAALAGATPAIARPEGAERKVRIARPGGGALRVGLVELDTSHAPGLAQAIAGMEGIEVAAVLNRGLVYGADFTRKFAAEFGVKQVVETPAQMAPLVDVAMVLGVDWDRHVEDAEPFLAAGVPVFIDKPVVGRESEARRLLELAARHHTPLFGGSTYRYTDPVAAFKREFMSSPENVTLTVYGKINSHSRDDMLDLIYYGIHGAELMQELMGPGADRVSYVDFYRKQHLIHVHYDDRPPVILCLGWARDRNEAHLLTDSSLEVMTPGAGESYGRIFSLMADSLATGRTERQINEQLEACRVLIAAQKSRLLGRPVALSELTDQDGFDGAEFALEYSRLRNLPPEQLRGWRDHER